MGTLAAGSGWATEKGSTHVGRVAARVLPERATAGAGRHTGRPYRGRRGSMANSKYEYVKQYEFDDRLLPGCWIVVRVDGKGFTKWVLWDWSNQPPGAGQCRTPAGTTCVAARKNCRLIAVSRGAVGVRYVLY